jgi:hypothetical protein
MGLLDFHRANGLACLVHRLVGCHQKQLLLRYSCLPRQRLNQISSQPDMDSVLRHFRDPDLPRFPLASSTNGGGMPRKA